MGFAHHTRCSTHAIAALWDLEAPPRSHCTTAHLQMALSAPMCNVAPPGTQLSLAPCRAKVGMPNWSKKVLLHGENMGMAICSKKDATLVRGLFFRMKV
jgi:hypothetical protein